MIVSVIAVSIAFGADKVATPPPLGWNSYDPTVLVTENSFTPTSIILRPTSSHTVMSMPCSIARSPLIMGGDLPSFADDPATLALLTNDAVLNVDQYSDKNRQISLDSDSAVWAAEDLAMFNRGDESRKLAAKFSELGLTASEHAVKELWRGDDLGNFYDSFERPLDRHAAGLYCISSKSAP